MPPPQFGHQVTVEVVLGQRQGHGRRHQAFADDERALLSDLTFQYPQILDCYRHQFTVVPVMVFTQETVHLCLGLGVTVYTDYHRFVSLSDILANTVIQII